MNALDPQATRKNQRIYKFSIADREIPSMNLDSEKGVLIRKSLFFLDLFSFDVEGDSAFRLNLERCFGRYEEDISKYSRDVIANVTSGNLSELSQPIVGLFAAKLMNLFRNPYSFVKVMNTVGVAANYRFNDPEIDRVYERLLNGSRPQSERIFRDFGMNAQEYSRWLKALFMLFSEVNIGDKNYSSFQEIVNGIFASSYTLLHLYLYEDSAPEQVCLLSDRGITFCSKEEDPLALPSQNGVPRLAC